MLVKAIKIIPLSCLLSPKPLFRWKWSYQMIASQIGFPAEQIKCNSLSLIWASHRGFLIRGTMMTRGFSSSSTQRQSLWEAVVQRVCLAKAHWSPFAESSGSWLANTLYWTFRLKELDTLSFRSSSVYQIYWPPLLRHKTPTGLHTEANRREVEVCRLTSEQANVNL